MRFLVIAGHISHDARKYEHLIDLYDQMFINNIILPLANEGDKIDVICSPNCFNSQNKDERLSYRMITENDVLAAEWIKKNIQDYNFIFALSDVYALLKDESVIKTKPCVVFNTLSVNNKLSWSDFLDLTEHSCKMLNALCGISRFIEEPNRYFILHQDGSRVECFGSESIAQYFQCLLSKNKCSIGISRIKEMPTLKQTLIYDDLYKSIADLEISWLKKEDFRIAYFDDEQQRYLTSFDKDNTTFSLVSASEHGSESGKVEVSHTVSKEYFKMIQIMKLRKNYDLCVYFPANYNFLNALYVIPNCPEGYFTTKKEILSSLNEVFFARDYSFQKAYLVYEEGRGYYLVGKKIFDIITLLKDYKLLTSNIVPSFYRDKQKNLEHIQKNLSDKFWKHFRSQIEISKNDRILDMEAVNDSVCKNLPSETQVYQHNKFSEFNEDTYIGKLHPAIKYDHIIFAGTYYTMALAHSEVERYWNWLYLLLAPEGKVHIIGQDILEPKGITKPQILIGESSLGLYQVLYNEMAAPLTRRMAIFDGKILSYFNPLDTTSMNIITKQFSYKRAAYSAKSEIYIHSFSKRREKE